MRLVHKAGVKTALRSSVPGSCRRRKWRRLHSIWNGPLPVGTCTSMVSGTVFPGTEIKPEFGMIS